MSDFLGQLTSGLKRLTEIKKEMDELALKEAVLEQRELLLNAKEELLELRERVAELEQESAGMKEQSNKLAATLMVEGFRYDAKDDQPSGLPYCPNCEVAVDGKLFRLIRSNDYYSICPNCKTKYNVGKDGRVHESPSLKNSGPSKGINYLRT